ncbi:MAG TPA: NAD(P)-dependent oxidoreductase [Solirubrobacteraceae bacterium]|nr:NAD(P)-dependent oxidoreductase [Solirubrobacteraceae bacterium]
MSRSWADVPMTHVLKDDVEAALSDPAIPWHRFRAATILVTGATGVIGSAVVRVLCAADAAKGLGLTVVAQGRDPRKGRRLQAELGARFLAADVRGLSAAASGLDHADIVVHAAAVTSSAHMVARPDEILAIAVEGTRNVLDLALALGAGSVVYVSSMEVYGQGLTGVVTESDLGTLDPDDPRSSYPEGKRRAEALSTAYATECGLHTTNARLGLTFGAGVPNDPANTRVPLQFARAVLAGRDIELHTDGAGVTNVCYLADAVRALLLLATKGAAGEAYNVANPRASMTIRQMAEVVARDVAGGAINVVLNTPEDIESRGYAPPSSYRLGTDKIAALGWEPRYGMAEMYRRMIASWQS